MSVVPGIAAISYGDAYTIENLSLTAAATRPSTMQTVAG